MSRIASLLDENCSRLRTVEASQVVAAMLGLTGPIAIGAFIGHAEMGMATALGGVALSGEGKGLTTTERVLSLFSTLLAGTAAMVTGVAMAGHGRWTIFGLPALAMVAGLLGRISRPLARASRQFVLFTILASGFGVNGEHPFGIAFLFFLGAIWTASLSLVLRPFSHVMFSRSSHAALAEAPRPPKKTLRQLLRHWWDSLATLAGWQYPLRIFICLLAAQALELLWPFSHNYWIGLTVGIVVQRDLQSSLSRTLHRVVGTLLGVLIAGLLALEALPLWAIISIVAVLASMRPVFRDSNYIAYSAVHTPLIIILVDFGHTLSLVVSIDRFVATVAGCVISMIFGYLLWLKILAPRPLDENRERSHPLS
jgi:uncharacterized membrane protein YccC